MPRRRLDAELVRRGLAVSPVEARRAVEAGLVTVGGRPTATPETMVAADESLDLAAPGRPFVSRGGEKLAAALDRFAIEATGRRCLDAGASTGGFTDCLLQRGAAAVVAVDVGYGQLAWSLRDDRRVVVLERTNVRALTPEALPWRPSLIVADLSFISLRLVVPILAHCAAPAAEFVFLVKPQFEAHPDEVEAGGVVREVEVWRRVLGEVASAAARAGIESVAAMASPITGPAGNVEFLLEGRTGAAGSDPDVDAAIAEGRVLAG